MIAVIGAMDEEIRLLRERMTSCVEERAAKIRIFLGKFGDADIALAQCGIGKVNAAICTQILIDRYAPAALLFSGVAGGLLPNMNVGDIVVASHLIQWDVDLTAFGRRHGEIPGVGRQLEADPALVRQAASAFDRAFEGTGQNPSLMIGTVVSADRFIEDPAKLRWLQREFSALATEMEGAAIAHTCRVNEVPFVVVRAVSDGAGDSAGKDFQANLSLAAKNCSALLERLIPAVG